MASTNSRWSGVFQGIESVWLAEIHRASWHLASCDADLVFRNQEKTCFGKVILQYVANNLTPVVDSVCAHFGKPQVHIAKGSEVSIDIHKSKTDDISAIVASRR